MGEKPFWILLRVFIPQSWALLVINRDGVFLVRTPHTVFPPSLTVPEVYNGIGSVPEWTTRCFRRLEYSAKERPQPWASQRNGFSPGDRKWGTGSASFSKLSTRKAFLTIAPCFQWLTLVSLTYAMKFQLGTQQMLPLNVLNYRWDSLSIFYSNFFIEVSIIYYFPFVWLVWFGFRTV